MEFNYQQPGQPAGLLTLPTPTTPGLTPTQYGNLMLHPSGYYIDNGMAYEPIKSKKGALTPYTSKLTNAMNYGGYAFKPFTKSADGIFEGKLSMAGNLPEATYRPYPNAMLGFLANPSDVLAQAQQAGVPSYGAGRFAGILGGMPTTSA